MADVIGPCSTLPGAVHKLPAGARCDTHPERLAVKRIQGETDSFGAELNDMCQECVDEYRAYVAQARPGVCDWCKKESLDLRPRRDFEEGSYGPVYRVCCSCVEREYQSLQDELDSGWY